MDCRRKQRLRSVLYEAFSSKSTTTFVPLPDFPLHFWRPTLAHLFWHSYIVMTTILCQSLSLQARHCGTAYFSDLRSQYFGATSDQLTIAFCTAVFPVPDRSYLVPSMFCNRHPLKLICHYHAIPLLSLEHVGWLVCCSSSVVAKSRVLTYDCYYHSVQQSFE